MAGNLSKRPLFPWINIPILHRKEIAMQVQSSGVATTKAALV
jgi:hypothetical protein